MNQLEHNCTGLCAPVKRGNAPKINLGQWISISHCVHVIDDDPTFREMVECTLQSVRLTVATYPSAERFLATRAIHAADCVLLDLRMPHMCGFELLDAMRSQRTRIPTLMVSAYREPSEIVAAMKKGAFDYLVKPISEVELFSKVSTALSKNLHDKMESADLDFRLSSLTERERQVMELFVAAHTTRQVARELDISPKTVEKHRLNIFGKMNVDSIPALIKQLQDTSSLVRFDD